MQMEKKSATLEVDMSAVTMKSHSKAKAMLGKGDPEADGTNLSSSYEAINEKAPYCRGVANAGRCASGQFQTCSSRLLLKTT